MKSNITLKSNIYINKSARSDDTEFLQHIRDYRILIQKQRSSYDPRVPPKWMTPVQTEILKRGQPNCSLEIGTISWGVPIDGDHMRCRCEQTDCHHFNDCSQFWNFDRIQRIEKYTNENTGNAKTYPLPLSDDQEDNSPSNTTRSSSQTPIAELETPSISESASTLESISTPDPLPVPVPDPIPAPEPIPALELSSDSEEPVENEIAGLQVVTQTRIIHAPISDRLWISAGPGTGKTYTVIQRLKLLLESGIEGSILVLCFSKNAVQVIRNRLIAEIGPDVSSYIEENTLVIRTFDSFATYMLDDELNASWDYDRRIEEFIQMLHRNTGVLNKLVYYLIVDEIQDTVGVRARMLLALLDELRCGTLLLGDQCQAIYDWMSRETQDMTFSALASELTKRRFKRFELEGNHRQNKELAKKCQALRQCMLNSDEPDQEIAIGELKKWLRDKWKSYDVKALSQGITTPNDLILCKTNGEASYISQFLFDNNISRHAIQSPNHQTLAPWIAKLLFGCDGQFMTKEAFFDNGSQYDITDIDSKWTALKTLDKHPHSPILHIRDVLNSLVKQDGVPACCLNRYSDCTIISTVHSAKGSEANRVFWLDTPLVYDKQREQEGALRDALNAAYVATTRAKSEIHMLTWTMRPCLKPIQNKRWIKIGFSKRNIPYCMGIAFLPGDTNPLSFATEEIQMILSRLEQGISVKLFPNVSERCFDIYYECQRIGATSQQFTTALFAGFEETNHTKNWPANISDAYISSIVTIIDPNAAGITPSLSTSGCWLSIELGGFSRLEWS